MKYEFILYVFLCKIKSGFRQVSEVSEISEKSVKKISVSEVSEFFGNVRFWGVFGIQNLNIFGVSLRSPPFLYAFT